MLLLEDRRFYVYVYLNPLKFGKCEYEINGETINFDYEPFYVGKGYGNRMTAHIKEWGKYVRNKKKCSKGNRHKLNTIDLIIKNNAYPIILKVMENLTETSASSWERCLIKIIGRKDLKKGPLTNLTDGGEGVVALNSTSRKKKGRRIRKFLQNNPESLEARVASFKETMKNHPEIKKEAVIKFKKTLLKNPKIKKRAVAKYKKTLKADSDITKKAIAKGCMTKKQNPEIMKKAGRNQSLTKIKNRTQSGVNHPKYTQIDVSILIPIYFSGKNIKDTLIEYNEQSSIKITRCMYNRFLSTLKFPKNSDNCKNFEKVFYQEFILKNKYIMAYYISNYAKFEKDFFDTKFRNKYGDDK